MPIRLHCATGNRAKLREFRLAAGSGVEILPLPSCDCPEDGATFEENATAKALCYSRAIVSGEQPAETPLVFADDSGLEVDGLGGAPGVYSARFAGPDASDAANNELLLEKLAGVPPEKRAARFVCCIALVKGDKLLGVFHGKAEGRIGDRSAGSGGFGYDPLFFFPPLSRTFAEIPAEEKWLHSHRGEAFRAMLEWLAAKEM